MVHTNHESYAAHAEIEGPSERSFGLTVGGILVAIGVFRWWLDSTAVESAALLAGIGILLIGFGAAAPRLLTPLNRMWTKLGVLLSRIANPVMMFLMFASVFVPAALVMRICGRDALRRRRDPKARSYWIDRRPPGPAPDTMINQF